MKPLSNVHLKALTQTATYFDNMHRPKLNELNTAMEIEELDGINIHNSYSFANPVMNDENSLFENFPSSSHYSENEFLRESFRK